MTDSSIRDDIQWNNTLKEYPIVNSVINALAVQDGDAKLMYTRGPNTTIMLTLSTKISLVSSSYEDHYLSAHRLFPGILRNRTDYDPPQRTWFKNAKDGSFYFYGPFIGGFYKYPLITLSSKKTIIDSVTKLPIVVVSAADMAVTEVSAIGEESTSKL